MNLSSALSHSDRPKYRSLVISLLSFIRCPPLPCTRTCLISTSPLCSCGKCLHLLINTVLSLCNVKMILISMHCSLFSSLAIQIDIQRFQRQGIFTWIKILCKILPITTALSTCFGSHHLFLTPSSPLSKNTLSLQTIHPIPKLQ